MRTALVYSNLAATIVSVALIPTKLTVLGFALGALFLANAVWIDFATKGEPS